MGTIGGRPMRPRSSRSLLLVACGAALLAAAGAASGSTQRPGAKRPRPLDTANADAFFPQDDDDEAIPSDFDEPEDADSNATELGMFLDSPCEFTCNSNLHHVFCNPISGRCECDKKYPVRVGISKGCAKPKKLGEQCFYQSTCTDEHASCVQVDHNAVCACDAGYHSVSYARPVKKIFCTEDMALLTADVPTLLGVASGIAVLAGLLCMVLHLYTRARFPRYPHPDHLADASLTPPILYALADQGIPHSSGARSESRPSSRSSARSIGTAGTLESGGGDGVGGGGERRGTRGVPVSASRAGAARAAAILLISCHLDGKRAAQRSLAAAGSRRPSLMSMHSSTSSIRSYSMKRFEKEREQKEKRQQMQMRLAQMQSNMAGEPKHAPTPSPRSPNNSTDGLLPSLSEIREMSLSRAVAMEDASNLRGIVGPCSSAGTSLQY